VQRELGLELGRRHLIAAALDELLETVDHEQVAVLVEER
jgi:hypothetical protein